MKYLKAWVCAACGCIQPELETHECPTWDCRCGASEFIRDEITIPDTAQVGTKESEL